MKNSEEHCRISQSRSWSLSVMYLSLLMLITLRRLLLLPECLDYRFPNRLLQLCGALSYTQEC